MVMDVFSLSQVSSHSLLTVSERSASNPWKSSFLSQFGPLHRQSLPSTCSSPLRNLHANTTLKCRSAVSMGTQTEEVAKADRAPASQPEVVEIPTYLEFVIPPESLAGFEADYERVSAQWPKGLATTRDDATIEKFISSAQALARRWLPEDLVSRLERFMYDPAEPAALVIRGLPIDKELPPTEPDAQLKKAGKCMSETWLVGIGRIVGQLFTFSYLRGTKPGMGMIVRELYPTRESALVDFRLDMHMDFFQVNPEVFPHIIGFMGLKGDPEKKGKTLLLSNQKLYQNLDPADIEVLRSDIISWHSQIGTQFSQHVIKGSESLPRFSLFEEDLPGMGGFDSMVKGTPEAVAAYKRVKEIAPKLSEGVLLDGGDVLLLNQKKAVHGRSPITAKFDGNDRWLQRIYVNSGAFWDAGLCQWPKRAVPDP